MLRKCAKLILYCYRAYHFCSSEIEGMTDCMHRIYSSPKKPEDVFMSKLFAAKNIKSLARRLCALVPGNVSKNS